MANYLSFIGLCFDVLGALLLLAGVFHTKSKAVEIGVTRSAGDTEEENLKLPAVTNLIFQSRSAVWGTASLVGGFVLQAAAVWPF